jgi:hypothetical protein
VEQYELFKTKPPTPRKRKEPQEYKVIALRECPLPEAMHRCETPEDAASYWRTHITTTPHFDPERECMVVLLLNTRRRIKGHHFVSIGTMDTLLVHPREIFRTACIMAASALLLMHNLCVAAHKFFFVARRVMCSRVADALASVQFRQREECYATG